MSDQVIVLGPTTNHPSSRNKRILCRCACGKEWPVRVIDFTRGQIRSCGCMKYAYTAASNTTHGHASAKRPNGRRVSKEYNTWQHIIDRCINKKNKRYSDYGGRGIMVCKEWVESFECFLNDVGMAPSKRHTIDRDNNNGHYEPNNCRWATVRTQNRNKRSNVPLTLDGQTLLIVEWAELLKIKADTLYMRHHRGWTPERILTTPVRAR